MSLKNWWNRSQIKERKYKRLRFINRIRIGWVIIGVGLITAFVGAVISVADYYSTLYGLGVCVVIVGLILMATFGSEEIHDEETFSDNDTESRIP